MTAEELHEFAKICPNLKHDIELQMSAEKECMDEISCMLKEQIEQPNVKARAILEKRRPKLQSKVPPPQ